MNKPWSTQTLPQLTKESEELRQKIHIYERSYLLDGQLQREVERMENEGNQLEIYILQRKNQKLEQTIKRLKKNR